MTLNQHGEPSRSSETLDRDALAARTDGRTDERTKIPTRHATISPLSDAHARVEADDVVGLDQVLESGFLPTRERFPIVRRGERTEIPWHVRSAVWYRDNATCQLCRVRRPKPWHLDHIVPWSAGGSDHTSNLRMLCEPCNVERSNYDDRTVFAKRPATWWCHRCYGPEHQWRYDHPSWNGSSSGVLCGKYQYGHRACRVTALYDQAIARGDAAAWHQRRPVEAADLIAYCAHCNVVGMTDVTL